MLGPGTARDGLPASFLTLAESASALSVVAAIAACGTNGPTEPVPSQVVVAPSLDTLFFLGDTVSLSAEVVDASGVILSDASVSWSTTASQVATVNGAGRVTAVGSGGAYIIGAAGLVRDSMRLIVIQRP